MRGYSLGVLFLFPMIFLHIEKVNKYIKKRKKIKYLCCDFSKIRIKSLTERVLDVLIVVKKQKKNEKKMVNY